MRKKNFLIKASTFTLLFYILILNIEVTSEEF